MPEINNSWGMIGHSWATDILRKHIANQRLRHAYLITGPPGVGRRTLALRISQSLNCTQPLAPGVPCRNCHTCQRIAMMQHPDLSIVEAEEGSRTIKIDQVRTLQRGIMLAPYEAPYRIALLLNFEQANPNAANALLKLLEEPPPKVIMLLTALDTESLLPTIVSRCEQIPLRSLSIEITAQGLETQWDIPAEEAKSLSHISGGRPGFAITLHQNTDIAQQRTDWLDDHQRMLKANRVARFQYAETIAKDKIKLDQLLQTWLSLWRDVMLLTHDAATPISNIDREEEINRLATSVDRSTAQLVIRQLERAQSLISKNINARLTAEVTLLDLPYLR
ncbi:MAG: DNA polymerase III subunit delta' [Chloroflexi bacterium]|nr:DNA polymerase III subunit delta' [Chloroflexota bacterium]